MKAPRILTLIACLGLAPIFALGQNAQVRTDAKTVEGEGKTKTTVTVEIDVKTPAAPAVASDRSAILVLRANSAPATSFASLLSAKLASRSAASGVSVSPTENAAQTESQMIVESRGRGAHYLIDVTVAQFSTATATILGQEQRRMAATLAWRVIDVTGTNSAVASGEAKDFSLNDPVLPVDEQSSALADSLAAKAGDAISAALGKAQTRNINDIAVPVSIVADELTFPGIVISKDNTLARSTENLQVKLSGFTLLVDGIAVGTVSGDEPIYLPEGLHMVAFQRNGFEPWSQRVRVTKNLKLNPVIRPDEAGLARWRSQIGYMQGLTMGAKLDEAQVARIKADAERLAQSGYRIDVRMDRKENVQSDVKVNAKELPEQKVIVK
jgi:hypothetical protein